MMEEEEMLKICENEKKNTDILMNKLD